MDSFVEIVVVALVAILLLVTGRTAWERKNAEKESLNEQLQEVIRLKEIARKKQEARQKQLEKDLEEINRRLDETEENDLTTGEAAAYIRGRYRDINRRTK